MYQKLTKKQKIIGGVTIALLLLISLLYNSELLRNRQVADENDVARLQEEENKDLHSVTEYKAPEEETPETPAGTITSFYISGSDQKVAPGGSLTFTGYFEGTGDYPKVITWTLQGDHHPETTIDPEGVLKVSPGETQKQLNVRGVSQYDTSKVGELAVAVESQTVATTPTTTPTTSVGKPKNKTELKQKAQEVKNQVSAEEVAKKEEELKKAKAQAIAKDQSSAGQKDKYLTDPTPEGKPKPVEPTGQIDTNNPQKVYLSIDCSTILNNMDLFNMDKIDVLPVDGVILKKTEVTFYPGESVYDLLKREMQNRKIHMESSFTPVYNSAYIEGINNLYEFDCGEGSGWMYRVNGWFPNYGVSRYAISPGDTIEFLYTCDLGKDVEDNSMTK